MQGPALPLIRYTVEKFILQIYTFSHGKST